MELFAGLLLLFESKHPLPDDTWKGFELHQPSTIQTFGLIEVCSCHEGRTFTYKKHWEHED